MLSMSCLILSFPCFSVQSGDLLIHFDLVIVIDWSAAASPGPQKPSSDRCWIAWQSRNHVSEAEYFRTRHACMERLRALLQENPGNALLAFDFPFGYPAGSGLGGGRSAGHTISKDMVSSQQDLNNRFDVAAILNSQISKEPGPFWGHPISRNFSTLTRKKPPFNHTGFSEWRLVEKRLRDRKYPIMNVWQLLGQGSVGSQTLTGLVELLKLAENPDFGDRVRYWPFETDWDACLDGIIFAELWPSLGRHQEIDHPIKDARQVLASRNWLCQEQKTGRIRSVFAPPSTLTVLEKRQCETEEGWILGVG